MLIRNRLHPCLAALLLLTSAAFSQKQTEKWYWAGSPAAAVDFTPATPTALFNNGITFSHESGTSLADANGNLLFYADGNAVVFNRNHVAMTNGTGLVMHNSVTQGCIFIPKPGSTTLYYLFHIGVPNLGSPPYHLYYSEIDISLSGGLGAVTASKNISIASSFASCAEKITATRHCNGTDIWVVVHSYIGNTYRAYLVTAAGVNTTPVVSNVGTAFSATVPDNMGQMKISSSGTKIATTLYDQGIVDICDFNSATGAVSNPVSSGPLGQWMYGLEFSPDNTKLYFSVTSNPPRLVQMDLCAGAPAAIIASATTVASNVNVYSMQMARDGKVYAANSSGTLGVINNPNVAGLGCNYVVNGISVAPSNSWLGLPNFITSYFDLPANKPQATVVPVNAGSCSATGSATASICSVFGVAPYTYTWSNGTVTGPTSGFTSSISNLAPGTYSVIVNDATCRTDTAVFTISGGGNSFTITPTTAAATCGSNNGTASAAVTGGTSPFTYVWNPGGQTSSAISGLAAGNYTVVITDANNCTSASVINVPVSGGNSVTVTPQNISCNGGGNGSATANVTGGTSPYTFVWSNGVSTSAVTGLAPGNYSVTVTDVSGCTGTQTFSISQSPAITGNVAVTNSSCGQSTGSAVVTAGGGTPAYSFLWTNGQSTASATGLAAGTYSCTITDSFGCTFLTTAVILNNNGPTALVNSINASCNGSSDGSASVSASGGTGPYSYQWVPGSSTTSSVSGLSAGTYTVIVSDASGCTWSSVVNILNGTGPTASAGADVTIQQGNSANLSASGGATYAWSPATGLNNAAIANPIASPSVTTQYCVIVTDAGGCSDSACVTVYVELPCGEFYLPNAFSPNGDLENDEFMAYINPDCVLEFKMTIYNRWGEKVFETDDLSKTWKGDWKDGGPNAAVYAYFCRAKLTNGKEIITEGNVNLVR